MKNISWWNTWNHTSLIHYSYIYLYWKRVENKVEINRQNSRQFMKCGLKDRTFNSSGDSKYCKSSNCECLVMSVLVCQKGKSRSTKICTPSFFLFMGTLLCLHVCLCTRTFYGFRHPVNYTGSINTVTS